MTSGSFQWDSVLGNFQVTTLMLLAPLLAFLRPLFLFIGKATFFTNIEGLPVFLHLLDHRSSHSVYQAILPAVEGIGEPGVPPSPLRQRQQLSASQAHQSRLRQHKGQE